MYAYRNIIEMFKSRNSLLLAFIGVGLSQGVLYTTKTGNDTQCWQLGCDQKGAFSQDGFKFSIENKKFVVWHSYSPSVVPLNETDTNYGCVGKGDLIVCPYHDNPKGQSRHIMLNSQTAEEYSADNYTTLTSVGTPVLTKFGVFALNGSHASLVNPFKMMSDIIILPPSLFPNGFLSPVYLPDSNNTVLVIGNQSKMLALFRVSSEAAGKPVLELLVTFLIPKSGTPCPWLTIAEAAAFENRVYLYGFRNDDMTGLLAIDILEKAPYWKLAWELDDQSSGLSATDGADCPSEADGNLSGDPSIRIATQVAATSDGYIVITLPIAILVIKDNGSSAMVLPTMIMFGGAHFLSIDNSLVGSQANGRPYIWSTAWPDEIVYNGNLIGIDYVRGYKGLRFLTIDNYLNATEFEVTSRMMSFPHPEVVNKRVLVFGVRLNITNSTSIFFTKLCPDCKVGVSRVIMGVATSLYSTLVPDILWVTQIPGLGYNLEAKGQIIGVSDKLIAYVTDGKMGYIMGIK